MIHCKPNENANRDNRRNKAGLNDWIYEKAHVENKS